MLGIQTVRMVPVGGRGTRSVIAARGTREQHTEREVFTFIPSCFSRNEGHPAYRQRFDSKAGPNFLASTNDGHEMMKALYVGVT